MKRKLLSILVSLMLLSAFTMPAAAADNPFTDVPASSWYYRSVTEAYQQGLMYGVTDTRFAPNEPLTREMFIAILGRVAGIDKTAYKDMPTGFKDVPSGQWYSPYIAWAYASRVTSGVDVGVFGLGTNITREQMATFIYRYVNQSNLTLAKTENPVPFFRDASQVSSYAVSALEAMRVSGIISGDENRNFNPKANATRAEAATVFCKLANSLRLPEAADSLADMVMDSGTVTVYYTAAQAANIQVELLKDDLSTVIETSTVKVLSGTTIKQAKVSFPKDKVPDTFMLRATMKDLKGNELTEPLIITRYSAAYREFDEKDIYDFDADLVQNFDADPETNFAVFNEDTRYVNEASPASGSDSTGAWFTLTSAAGKALKVGDPVCLETEDAYHTFVVTSTKSTGSGMKVYYRDADIDEIYSYLHIKIMGTQEKAQGDSMEGIFEDINTPLTAYPFDIKDVYLQYGPYKISPEFSGTLTPHLEVVWSKDFGSINLPFTDTTVDVSTPWFELDAYVDLDSEGTFTVEATNDFDDNEQIIDMVIWGLDTDILPDALQKFNFELNLAFQLDAALSGKAVMDMSTSGTIGIHQTLLSKNLTSTVHTNINDIDAQVEIEVKLGPTVNFEVGLGSIFDVEAHGGLGGKIEALADVDVTPGSYQNSAASREHACSFCLDGTAMPYAEVSAGCAVDFTLPNGEKLELKKELEKAVSVCDEMTLVFHVSVVNELISPYKGATTFDFGRCENYVYRTNFRIEDDSKKLLNGTATVTRSDDVTNSVASGKHIYLYPGSYNASAAVNGISYSEDFVVTNSQQTVVLTSKAWLEAYAELLKERNTKYDRFALAYIDSDNIPELLISQGDFHVSASEIITYYNGQAVNLGCFGDFGTARFVPRQNLIYSFSWVNGYGAVEHFYKIQNGKAVELAGINPSKYTFKTFTNYDGYIPNTSNINAMLKNYTSFLFE
ncbi:MAG: S-layer homology domain-containing protein [Oscillospiraceae bacterium]|nr:S-layer homology domain-containing protein [Oscillospiraceae bacterium]